MNFSTVALSLAGFGLYLCSMSALGRWLAACRDTSTIAYVSPVAHGTVGL